MWMKHPFGRNTLAVSINKKYNVLTINKNMHRHIRTNQTPNIGFGKVKYNIIIARNFIVMYFGDVCTHYVSRIPNIGLHKKIKEQILPLINQLYPADGTTYAFKVNYDESTKAYIIDINGGVNTTRGARK